MNRSASSSSKEFCPAEQTLAAIAGRWKLAIVRELWNDKKRFGELQRAIAGITQKVLTQQLRELEADGLVDRQVYPQVPPKVEYSLTTLGESLRPIIQQMHDWSVDRAQPEETDAPPILPN